MRAIGLGACWMVGLLMVVPFLACIQVDVGPLIPSLSTTGSSFIVKGTAGTAEGENGSCLAWYADNGVIYHLFQTSGVSNQDFDRITTPGVTSRLEIALRTDLEVACNVGTTVQVQQVLEIVGQ